MTLKNILIVDDAMDLGRMLQAALETLGSDIRVTLVPSAEEGFLEASRRGMDLVVADIRLPGVSGLELTRKIRARNPDAKIIQISGLNEPDLESRSLEAGADLFLPKPLKVADFLESVQQVMGMSAKPAPVRRPQHQPSNGLEDYLAEFGRRLDAAAILLVEMNGTVRHRSGKLPEESMEKPIIDALLAAQPVNARAAGLMGAETRTQVLAFQGSQFDLVAGPVAGTHLLIAVLPKRRSLVRLAVALDEFSSAESDLTGLLPGVSAAAAAAISRVDHQVEKKPVHTESKLRSETARERKAAVPEPEPEPAPEEPVGEVSPEFAALFGDGMDKLGKNADAFWQSAVDKEDASKSVNPNTISYDQARQMGIAPDAPQE